MTELALLHQESFRLCIRDFFSAFIPELLTCFQFETVRFLEEEESVSLAAHTMQADADELIEIERKIDGGQENSLLYWEQRDNKPHDFEKKMFYQCCRLFGEHELLVLPVILFTGPVDLKTPLKNKYDVIIDQYRVVSFEFSLIELGRITKQKFSELPEDNPLRWAYLPYMENDPEQRPLNTAIALQGIVHSLDVKERVKITTLSELVIKSMALNAEERMQLKNIFKKDNRLKEAKIMYSIRESNIEEGRVEGREEGERSSAIKIAKNLLKKDMDWEYVTDVTGITPDEIKVEIN